MQRQRVAAREQVGVVPDRRRVPSIAGAVAVSIAGSIVHNAREFGSAAVLANQNGEFIIAAIMGGAFLVWWQVAKARSAAAGILLAFALLNLVGGAILTALPLSFLPFVPEQSWDHYLSHILYGTAQLPLVVLGIREIRHLTNRGTVPHADKSPV